MDTSGRQCGVVRRFGRTCIRASDGTCRSPRPESPPPPIVGGRESNPHLADSRFSNSTTSPPSRPVFHPLQWGSERFTSTFPRRLQTACSGTAGVEPPASRPESGALPLMLRSRPPSCRRVSTAHDCRPSGAGGSRTRVRKHDGMVLYVRSPLWGVPGSDPSGVGRRLKCPPRFTAATGLGLVARPIGLPWPGRRPCAPPLGGEGESANILGDYSFDAIDDGCRIIPRHADRNPRNASVENRIGPYRGVRSCLAASDGRPPGRTPPSMALTPCTAPAPCAGNNFRSALRFSNPDAMRGRHPRRSMRPGREPRRHRPAAACMRPRSGDARVRRVEPWDP